jgi:cell division protein FtsQ
MSALLLPRQRRRRLLGDLFRDARPGDVLRWSRIQLGRVIVGSLLVASMAGVGLLLLIAYRAVTSHPYFTLRSVAIEGSQRLSVSDVVALTSVSLGQNVLALNISDMESRLAANPWVKQVSIRRELPDALRIILRERQAAFWVRQGKTLYYAGSDGRPIEELVSERFASLPVLEVRPGAERFYDQLESLVERAQHNEFFFGMQQVAMITADPERGLLVRLDAEGLTLATELDDWRQGLARMALVWADLGKRGERDRVKGMRSRGDKVWVTISGLGL